ncbi:MAG: vitamin K epoxide reductase family protein [Pyrinomonadaceae bacterium]
MDPEFSDTKPSASIAKLPAAAAIVALLGIADTVYLTVHHYTAEPVPCSIIEGCEQVLTSQWAELGGIANAVFGSSAFLPEALVHFPLAAIGGIGYFIAFSLALLAAFGDSRMWKIFGVQATIMICVSAYLVYVQGMLIGAFCQFCLASALTTLILFTIYLISIFSSRKRA